MPNLDEKIIRAKNQHEADWLNKRGVTAVDVGYKYVCGKKTGEFAIRVHVKNKRDGIPLVERIPPAIGSIKTDVIQNTFVPHSMSLSIGVVMNVGGVTKYDPLKGGISIGLCRPINGHTFAGTLGAIVRDNRSNAPVMLSSFNVMVPDNNSALGPQVTQPSLIDGGDCSRDVVGTFQTGFLDDEVDCALARIIGRGFIDEIADIGPIRGPAAVELGNAVRKRGRSTELTFGTVDGINATVNINYGGKLGGRKTLTNQITLAVDPTYSTTFGERGDSGSVVVNGNDEVIGLYFAGNDTGTTCLANPIQSVLQRLNCHFPPIRRSWRSRISGR